MNTGIAEIPLTQSKVAIVDAIHYDWLVQWKWHAIFTRCTYYAVRKRRGKNGNVLMHREIARRDGNLDSIDSNVGHLNGNTLDNRVANLEFEGIVVPKTVLEDPIKPVTPVHPLPFPDLSNREFGLLWVLGLKEVGRLHPKDLWLCRCSCGNSARFTIPGAYLRSHESWSCGCSSGSNYPKLTVANQLIVEGQVVVL